MSNAPASAPPSVQVSASFSVSVADTGVPISTPASVFSGTARAVLSPSKNDGAVLDVGGSTGTTTSSISVTLIVTVIVAVSVPSEAVIVTVYCGFVS